MLLITKHLLITKEAPFLLKWGGETHGTKLNIICILQKGII